MKELSSPGTMKAPLFSEQVALICGMDEAKAFELKQFLKLAQDNPAMPSFRTLIRGAIASAGVAMLAMGVAAFVPESGAIGFAVAPLALGAAAWLARMALTAQQNEAAGLVQTLAHTIAKRARSER